MFQDTPKKDLAHAYAVIMAGGSGTRLWPLSRKQKPKQFQALLSSQTLIQETFSRMLKIVSVENIFVSTTKEYAHLVLEQLPQISEKNLILEPKSRNTAPAIALVSATLHKRDPQAVIAIISSDHAIKNEEEFTQTISAAFVAATENREKLVIIGINPTAPDTGLGYIKMGEEFKTIQGKRIFSVDAFKEKPDQKTAEEYCAHWEYLWNAGYFIFAAQTFNQWTEKFSPEMHAAITKIVATENREKETIEKIYAETPSEPVDILIVEKLSVAERLVIPTALKWSDVGNWKTLYDFLQEESESSNQPHQENHIDLGSHALFVHTNGRLIATVGLDDVVIVDTPDALLVAKREHVSGEMKKLIEKIKETGKEKYL